MLPPYLFSNRIFVIAAVVTSLTAMALIGANVFLPLFFQLVRGASPSVAGLMIAPLMGGLIISSMVIEPAIARRWPTNTFWTLLSSSCVGRSRKRRAALAIERKSSPTL